MKVISDFFLSLEKERWSGEVDITASQGHLHLLIADGQLVWINRPLDRALERFQRLSWLELPDPKEWNEYRTWPELISKLLEINTESYAKLISHLKTDRIELFHRLFFWTNVELLPRASTAQLHDPVKFGFYTPKKFTSLLREAKSRVEEWPRIQKRIGSSKRSFVSTVELPPVYRNMELDTIDQSLKAFEKSTGSLTQLPPLPYSAEEIEILRLCDGSHSVQDLVRDAPDGEFLTLRRLVDLWRKGALRPKDGEEDTLTNFRISLDGISIRESLIGIAMLGLFVIFLIAYRQAEIHLYPLAGLSERSEQQLQEALEIYRKQQGAYPFSLRELAAHGLISSSSTSGFAYTFKGNFGYELKRQ